MGYRIRLGKVNKDHESVRNWSTQELDNYFEDYKTNGSYYNPKIFYTEYYEIGKYVEFPEHREPFYKNFNIVEEYECEFDIISKEGLKVIIEDYRNVIFNHVENFRITMEKLLNKEPPNEDELNAMHSHFRSLSSEWSGKHFLPYRLDEDDDCDGFIATSWKYEYAIFNLVYIYRTHDFKNDYLIYSGW